MIFLYEIIGSTTVLLSTILSCLLLIKFHKLNDLLKVVGIYIIVGTSIDIVSTALYQLQQSNLKFLHLFTLIEFVLLSYLFNALYAQHNSKFKLLYLAIPVTIFIIVNSIFIQDLNSFNSYSTTLCSAVIIGYCIHYFSLILENQNQNIQFQTTKWFIITVFIIHCISLIVMLFGNFFYEVSQQAQSYIWSFRSLIIFSTKIILLYFFYKLLFNKSNVQPG